MIVGLISDTHGLLRPQALDALRGSDAIVHAGDVGDPKILDALRAIAPVTAIRGNVDDEPWALTLPEITTVEIHGVTIHVLHDLKTLKLRPGVEIVVSGHSHKPLAEERQGVLYINPGSAGPVRFKLPVTVARLDLAYRPWKVEFLDLNKSIR